MNKMGLKINLDLSKLDKSRFIKGKSGVYTDLVAWVTPNQLTAIDSHGSVKQQATKEERDAGSDKDLPFIGKVDIFWTDDNSHIQQIKNQSTQDEFDDDIPF
jgi:hypothetical protein